MTFDVYSKGESPAHKRRTLLNVYISRIENMALALAKECHDMRRKINMLTINNTGSEFSEAAVEEVMESETESEQEGQKKD